MNLLLIALVACIPLILLSWLLPEKWQMYPVAIATVIFLGYVSPVSLVILTLSSLITYYVLQSNTSQPAATLVIVIQVRDRKSTRLNSSHRNTSRMPSSA